MKPFEIQPGIQIIDRIAEGATSIVYRAVATTSLPYANVGDRLAVKVFRYVPQGKSKIRFEREIQIGLSLTSPYLVRYYEYGMYEGDFEIKPYIVMEYLDGIGIRETIGRTHFEQSDYNTIISKLLLGVLFGLNELHHQGIVHRDLQPNNIIINKLDGRVVLLDFGCSKYLHQDTLTSLWEEIGTRRYWAPECLEPVYDNWKTGTDVFMLASCFIHLITGEYLFGQQKNYPSFFHALDRYAKDKDAFDERPPEWHCLPDTLLGTTRDLLWAMLSPVPEDRPTADEMMPILDRKCTDVSTNRHIQGYPITALLWSMYDIHEVDVIGYLASSGQNELTDKNLEEFFPRFNNVKLYGVSAVSFLGHWGLLLEKDISYLMPSKLVASEIAPYLWQTLLDHPDLVTKVFRGREQINRWITEKRIETREYPSFQFVNCDGCKYLLFPPDARGHTWEYELAVAHKLIDEIHVSSIELVRRRISSNRTIVIDDDGEID